MMQVVTDMDGSHLLVMPCAKLKDRAMIQLSCFKEAGAEVSWSREFKDVFETDEHGKSALIMKGHIDKLFRTNHFIGCISHTVPQVVSFSLKDSAYE